MELRRKVTIILGQPLKQAQMMRGWRRLMSDETVRVVVDAMGGDNAPEEIVKGAVQAVNKHENSQSRLRG